MQYTTVLDTLQTGVVEKTRCQVEPPSICTKDTFYQDSLRGELTRLIQSNSFVFRAHIGKVKPYLGCIDNDCLNFAMKESISVFIDTIYKGTSSMSSFWFTKPYIVTGGNYSNLQNNQFIGFSAAIDSQSIVVNVSSSQLCQEEDNGYFIDDTLILKKGTNGYPGLSISISAFYALLNGSSIVPRHCLKSNRTPIRIEKRIVIDGVFFSVYAKPELRGMTIIGTDLSGRILFSHIINGESFFFCLSKSSRMIIVKVNTEKEMVSFHAF